MGYKMWWSYIPGGRSVYTGLIFGMLILFHNWRVYIRLGDLYKGGIITGFYGMFYMYINFNYYSSIFHITDAFVLLFFINATTFMLLKRVKEIICIWAGLDLALWWYLQILEMPRKGFRIGILKKNPMVKSYF